MITLSVGWAWLSGLGLFALGAMAGVALSAGAAVALARRYASEKVNETFVACAVKVSEANKRADEYGKAQIGAAKKEAYEASVKAVRAEEDRNRVALKLARVEAQLETALREAKQAESALEAAGQQMAAFIRLHRDGGAGC